jgi:hypothetical protein
LELDRARRRDGLEVAAEGGHAHASQLRHVLHPEGLGVVVADPSHCLPICTLIHVDCLVTAGAPNGLICIGQQLGALIPGVMARRELP